MSRTHMLGVTLAASLTLAACASGGATTAPATSTSPAVSTPVASSAASDDPAASSTPSSSAAALPDPSACSAPATVTTAQTEGPYYKAGSPERTDLTEPGMAGTRLTLALRVVTPDCTPVDGAVIDLWQADGSGTYDNTGYTLRGHTATDASGGAVVLTIVPGEYPGRTEHIHVKVTPPGGATLTTQLYFPGVTTNDQDGIYRPDLVLDLTTAADGLVGTFTFVVPA
jgi:protocatechuate 3,4-dioxygenase beta subunit